MLDEFYWSGDAILNGAVYRECNWTMKKNLVVSGDHEITNIEGIKVDANVW